ncbi:hypothetical protein TNCV_4878781 [Trichonephila clavipes]|nr:hypothetical protein TNCV_4878781 [Trichonephila clavipes]
MMKESMRNLLARAFRAALPALRKLSHPDDKACEIFQSYVALKNGRNYVAHNSAITFNRANVQSISIGFWNANGQRSKIHEKQSEHFVLEQNLDLFLVQETKLEPGQEP